MLTLEVKFPALLYPLVKIAVRLALKIFCKSINIGNPENAETPGPLLIVANHPNSFLDAIIIGSLFSRPVHFLARGDAFKKPLHNRILRMLNMIPVYRLSEGRENLFLNEAAFARSKEILAQNGMVLIFIEGICVHKHEMQPFKKGAARIALDSRSRNGFRIMPVGIAYDSFEKFGKKININLGDALPAANLFPPDEGNLRTRYFNSVMHKEIAERIQIPPSGQNREKRKIFFLVLPGIVGRLLHFPLYTTLRKTIQRKTTGTVFFDSVLFGVLLILYPVYLLLLWLLLGQLHVPVLIIVIILLFHPLTAWCAVQTK